MSSSVETYTDLFQELLLEGRQLKPAQAIEPILRAEDLGDNIGKFSSLAQDVGNKSYAAIETAVRNIFYNLLVTYHLLTLNVYSSYAIRQITQSKIVLSAKYGISLTS